MEDLFAALAKMYEKYSVNKEDVMVINRIFADALTKAQMDIFDGCLENIVNIKEDYKKYVVATRKKLGI